jgi:hypothetical protein
VEGEQPSRRSGAAAIDLAFAALLGGNGCRWVEPVHFCMLPPPRRVVTCPVRERMGVVVDGAGPTWRVVVGWVLLLLLDGITYELLGCFQLLASGGSHTLHAG